MIAVNLIPMARRLAAARRRRIRRWGIVGGFYAVVLACAYGSVVLPGSVGSATLDARIRDVASQAADSEAQTKKVQAEYEAVQSRLRAVRRVTGHPDWSVLLGLISRAREGQVVFEVCELEPLAASPAKTAPKPADAAPGGTAPTSPAPAPSGTRYVLRLNGMATQQQEIPKFVLRLEALQLFENVTLLESQARQLDEAEVFAFRIECGLRDPGGAKP